MSPLPKMTHQSVLTQLQERDSRRRVRLVETSKLRFEIDSSPDVEGYFCTSEEVFPVRPIGMHTFLNSFTPMPQRYASKLRELGQFTLLRDNVELWINELRKSHAVLKMVTEDDHVIAVGSENFQHVPTSRTLECLPRDWHYEMLAGDRRDRVRVFEPSRFCQFGEVTHGVHRKVSDDYHLGFQVGNSEIGMGALNVNCFLWRLICTNGAIVIVNGSSGLIHEVHVAKDPAGLMDSFNRMVPQIVKRIPELHDVVVAQIQNAEADKVKQTHRDLLKRFKEDAQVSRSAFVKMFRGPEDADKSTLDAWLDTTWTGRRLDLVNTITFGARNLAAESRANLEELAGKILHSN